MRTQTGLTALELLIVVAIIAMMAAVAVPRFSSLDRQARVEAVVSLADGVSSSAELAHEIWLAAGRPDTLKFQGETLQVANGYLTERSVAATVVAPGGFRESRGMWVHVDARSALDCGVIYLPPASEGVPATVNAYTAGC